MDKNKMIIASGVGVLSAVAVAYFLKQKSTDEAYSTFENAGIPDQMKNNNLAQLENSKMVSEGSQFGVQYYNQMKSEIENAT